MASSNDSPLMVMGCDERYGFPLSVAMFSALRSSSKPLRILVLSDHITPATQDKIRKVAERGGAKSFDTLEVDVSSFTRLKAGLPHLSPAAFSRILIPSLLPTEDRCLWIDSDVLVRRDLVELYSEDLHGLPLGAVQCYYVPNLGDSFGIPYFRGVKENPNRPYLNSGILLLDLARWRNEGIVEQVNQFIEEYAAQFVAGDQDILNAVLIDRWQSLPVHWNDQEMANDKPRTVAATAQANIRHFSGPQKPWNSGLFDPDCKQWLMCAKETGYYSPSQFVAWRLQRFNKVLRGTTTNWLKSRGWMR